MPSLEKWGLIVSCEHARNRIPDALGTLGLTRAVLESHVAWDPGAEPVTHAVSNRYRVRPFIGEWSRLVADLNRAPENRKEVVPRVAFGTPIPGNADLDEEAFQRRLERFHQPYQRAVFEHVEEMLAASGDRPVLHLSVHSMTENLNGNHRPMSVSLMFDPDRPLERHIADIFHERMNAFGYSTAENIPYDGRDDAMVQACRQRYANRPYGPIEIEINHRHLDEIERMTECVLSCVEALEERPFEE